MYNFEGLWAIALSCCDNWLYNTRNVKAPKNRNACRQAQELSQVLEGKTFLPENYVWKINKMPEYYVIFAQKIIKMPVFLWYLPKN